MTGLKPGWDGQNANKLSATARAEIKRQGAQYRPDQVLPSEVRLSQGEFWTVSDLQGAVKRWFGVEYTGEDSYRTLVYEAGLSYQRAEGGIGPSRARRRLLILRRRLKKVIDFRQAHSDGLIVAMDPMSLYFQATLKRVWFPSGQTPLVRISPNRAQGHYYGALDLRTGQELAVSLPALSGEGPRHFLRHGLTCLPNRPIVLLLDRAPWHTATEVQHFIATQPGLDRLFFPPACPALKPPEPVWKQARQDVSHPHPFPEFPTLCRAFSAFLDSPLFGFAWFRQYIPSVLCHSGFG